LFIIGITGGSGSGKTTVAQLFANHGGAMIDADAVYHEMLEHCTPMQKEIIEQFPTTKTAEGKVDRSILAHIVFRNDHELGKLNSITQPYIVEELERRFEGCYRENQPFVVLDVIRLFESGLSKLCDVTVGVIAPESVRVSRIMERDKIPELRAWERVRAQASNEYYETKCDHILVNDGETNLDEAAEELYREIMEENV